MIELLSKKEINTGLCLLSIGITISSTNERYPFRMILYRGIALLRYISHVSIKSIMLCFYLCR